jgi:hypothetical protein
MILVLGFFLLLLASPRLHAQKNWVMMNPDFTSAAYGPSGFVAYGWTPGIGGSPSAIYTSTDGESWMPHRTEDLILNFLSADADYYYSPWPWMGVSTNGLSWKTLVPSPNASLTAMAFSSNLFVSVGYRGAIFTSTDRTNWVNHAFGEDNWFGAAYGTNKFVIVGDKGAIASSIDGAAWNRVTSPTTNSLNSIAASPGGFVAVGEQGTIVFSEDGQQWKTVGSGSTNRLVAVASGGGKFVTVGANSTILYSGNGETWSQVHSDSSLILRSVCFGNGHFVAVGEEGTITSSEDGEHWTLRHHVPNYIGKLYFANDRFLALLFSGNYSVAQNPHLWTNAWMGTSNRLTCAAYALDKWVVGTDTNMFLVSSNLSDWISVPGPPLGVSDICFGNGQFVAVGYKGTILTSKDGLAWRQRTTGTVLLMAVTYGNNKYVAVGTSGTIVSSDDGITWTWRASGDVTFYSVTYGKGLFVAVGDATGTTATSTDGITWTQNHTGSQWYDIIFANNQFLAVGDFGSIRSSRDGKYWNYRGTFLGHIHAVAYGQRVFLVFSGQGVLWQGEPDLFFSGVKATENQLAFEVSGSRQNSIIESSIDFKSWHEEMTISENAEVSSVQLPGSARIGQMFFRVRQP